MKSPNQPSRAFTLIELMVVVAIIGLLVAVLLPSFASARNKARQAQAAAQFNALDTGLNQLRGESALGGALPPSASDNPDDFQVIRNPRDKRDGGPEDIRITGGHLLVHALKGADQLGPPGFRDRDRDGKWWNDTHDDTKGLYELDEDTGKELAPRYGAGGYVDDKMMEQAKSLRQLEGDGLILNLSAADPKVARDELLFIDPWGMPILYYKANSFNVRMTTDTAAKKPGIFRQEDNGLITGSKGGITNFVGIDFGGGKEFKNTYYHNIAVAVSPDPIAKIVDIQEKTEFDYSFARFILNPSITTRPTPINKESYLLISAGPDGMYGTGDDATNWARDQN